MSSLHVVVLAAGQGKRMQSRRPKVLHELAGRPMLSYVVGAAKRLTPASVTIVYGHGGDLVPRTLEALDVHWCLQAEQLGTGHAVGLVMPDLPDDGEVLVLYGDVPLVETDTLRSLVDAASSGAVGLLTVELDDPSGYGRVLRDEERRVVGIVEHKDANEAELAVHEVNTGIVAAPVARLRGWLTALDADNAQGEFYLTDIIAMAVSEGVTVRTERAQNADEVLGVNDRLQLVHLERVYQRREAERLMRAGASLADPSRLDVRGDVRTGRDVFIDINVVLEGTVNIGEGARIGPNVLIRDSEIGTGVEILANCVIEGARVAEGSRVGPFARLRPGAELAEQVHIGNFVEVKNSNVGRASKVNHLSYIGDSSIGTGTNIGAGTITCNYDGANKHRTVIGNDVFVGSGVELVAPVTVGDGATIGAGSTVTRDAPPGKLTVERSKQLTLRGWKRPVKDRKP